jgi:hypothetical protein
MELLLSHIIRRVNVLVRLLVNARVFGTAFARMHEHEYEHTYG